MGFTEVFMNADTIEELPDFPGLSWCVESGGIVFTSGIAAIDDGFNIISSDPHEQADYCLKAALKLLAKFGCGVGDIVKTTCFAIDRDAGQAFAQKKMEMFKEHRPAGTIVMVKDLMVPGMLIEVEVVAVKERKA